MIEVHIVSYNTQVTLIKYLLTYLLTYFFTNLRIVNVKPDITTNLKVVVPSQQSSGPVFVSCSF